MGDLKLYTIKEFANKNNVTCQAIYKKLATSLKPYLVEVDGRKYIKSESFDECSDTKTKEQKQEFSNSIPDFSNAVNEIRERIIDLIVAQDTEIKVRHEDCNQYVDFEIGKSSGYRKALQVINEIMEKYNIKKTNLK